MRRAAATAMGLGLGPILMMLMVTPALASDRDAGLAEVMKIYNARADVVKHVEAVTRFAKLAAEHPTDKDLAIWCARTASYAAHRIGDSIVKKRVAGKGVKCAKRYIEQHPKDYDAQVWWILCRFRIEQAKGVIRTLKAADSVRDYIAKMIKLAPNRPEGLLALGTIYRELPGPPISFGDPEKGLVFLKKAAKYAPLNVEVLLELASAYAKIGDVANARKTYKLAIAKGTGPKNLEWETEDARDYCKKMLADLD